jgi:hypothetical protein
LSGEERPPFARWFPPDPELEDLVTAFAAGDYRTVRSEAPRLAERTGDPRVRRAALELRERIEPDPMQLYLMGLAAVLLFFLTLWFYLHKH